ncbi:hypothetical protein BS17DRAFT_199455 [Gyrodon lividus]|nr:hypothetical protein BS17DRAFT_199455 [Gyrodon lividus]
MEDPPSQRESQGRGTTEKPTLPWGVTLSSSTLDCRLRNLGTRPDSVSRTCATIVVLTQRLLDTTVAVRAMYQASR